MNRFRKIVFFKQNFLRIYTRSYSLTGKLKENEESEKILNEVEGLLGERSFRNVYWLIPDDLLNLASHMQQAKDINHPIADVARYDMNVFIN